MDDYVTGRQRNYALAMGIKVSHDSKGQEVSQMMDRMKPILKGPPNRQQLKLASQWSIMVSSKDSGWDVVGKLYEMILAQAFVLSVVRKIAGAKWQFYSESMLPNDWVVRMAKQLMSCPSRQEFVRSMDNSMSGTRSDAWYRFGKRQVESEAFLFVANTARQELARYLTPVSSHQGSRKARTQRVPVEVVKESGCSLVLVLAAAAILTLVASLFAAL